MMSPLSLAVVSECLSFDMGQAFWPFPPPEKVAVAGNLCLCRSHHNSMESKGLLEEFLCSTFELLGHLCTGARKAAE